MRMDFITYPTMRATSAMPLLAAVILLLFSALAAGQSGPVDNVEHIATVRGLRDPAVDATFADQGGEFATAAVPAVGTVFQ